jgi:hypothetical protein
MREYILAHVENSTNQYEEDSKGAIDKRMDPNWNFSHFFLTKEGSAFIYSRLSLFREASMIYQELEALFEETGIDIINPIDITNYSIIYITYFFYSFF